MTGGKEACFKLSVGFIMDVSFASRSLVLFGIFKQLQRTLNGSVSSSRSSRICSSFDCVFTEAWGEECFLSFASTVFLNNLGDNSESELTIDDVTEECVDAVEYELTSCLLGGE